MGAHRVGTLAELRDAGRILIDVGGRSIGVFDVDGELFALRNRCVHQGGPLCHGRVVPKLRASLDERGYPREHLVNDEKVICCPWHGVELDMRTGICLADPRRRVRTYETFVEADTVFVVV